MDTNGRWIYLDPMQSDRLYARPIEGGWILYKATPAGGYYAPESLAIGYAVNMDADPRERKAPIETSATLYATDGETLDELLAKAAEWAEDVATAVEAGWTPEGAL